MSSAAASDHAPRRGVSRWTKLGLLLASFVLALAVCELVLSALPANRIYRTWPPGLRNVFVPQSDIFSGIAGDSRFGVNSLGFRGDELPPGDSLRILALGGSTTECLYLDQDETWPALVQKQLAETLVRPVWVANAGKSGRTTREHELQVALLDQEPRFDCVLLLAGVNDLGLRLAQDKYYDPERRGDPARRLSRAFDVVPLSKEPGEFWRRLGVYRLLKRASEQWFETPRVQDDAGEIHRRWRAHRQGASVMRDELPDLSSALAEFRENLGRVADACRAHSVPLVLLTAPSMWRDDLTAEQQALLWLGGVGPFQDQPGAEYYSAAALARGLAAYNEVIMSMANEPGVGCIDVAGILGNDPTLFYDDVHFNEHGARRVAEVVAAALMSQKLAR